MMMRVAMAVVLLAGSAVAQQDAALDGAAITAALSGRALAYELGVVQTFHPDGRTDYADSTGRWRVDGDRYCSVWPPSDTWSCYAVFTIAGGIRFADDAGGVTEGFYHDS